MEIKLASETASAGPSRGADAATRLLASSHGLDFSLFQRPRSPGKDFRAKSS
jgi:hypothetical protein